MGAGAGRLVSAAGQVMERFRLDGQVAVVTGASRGIGKSLALALAAAGADLALLGREEATLIPVAREIEAELGRRALALAFDVGELDQHAPAVAAIEEQLGPVGILVNNAGINVRSESVSFSPEDWDRIL